jgi:hypothetical protein
MTRLELLTIVLGRARTNGFEFRRWYTARLGLPWISSEASLVLLEQQRRYYALLFSHDFAAAFWKPGEDITFSIPAQTFQRVLPNGSVITVTRKQFTRRSARPDAWRYHLRQMALAEEPLRYLRRYLNVEDDLAEDVSTASPGIASGPPDTFDSPDVSGKPNRGRAVKPAKSSAKNMLPEKKTRTKPLPRPLPTGLPAFLRRPYRPGPDSDS